MNIKTESEILQKKAQTINFEILKNLKIQRLSEIQKIVPYSCEKSGFYEERRWY